MLDNFFGKNQYFLRKVCFLFSMKKGQKLQKCKKKKVTKIVKV